MTHLPKAELTKFTGTKVMPPELWGYPGWLSESEFAALDRLRGRVVAEGLFHKDHIMEDRDLLRFLRARKFDVDATMRMLAADLEWRREFENRLIKATEAPAVVNFCNNGFLYRAGFDKDGRPVLVLRFALAFPREIKDTSEIVMFWVAYVHLLTQECLKCGCTDYTVIADLINFSPSKNFSLAMVKILLQILQNNYPERLAYCLVLNLPMAFRMGWNLIMPFIDERTKAKLHILGSNLSVLKDYIPEKYLEQEFGGKHPPYKKPDDLLAQFLAQGVVVQTGYFDVSPTRAEPASSVVEHGLPRQMSSSRLDRVRKLLTRKHTTPMGADEADGVKPSQVPKSAPRATVLGATGRTGVEVVRRLLQKKYDVCAFVRLQGGGAPPSLLKLYQDYTSEHLNLVVGDVLNELDLDRAIETSDVVISVMGAPKAMNDDHGFFEKTASAVVDSMKRNGTKRLIVVTAAQAKRMSKAWWDSNASVLQNSERHLYWNTHYSHIAEVEKLVASHADAIEYTFVRPFELDDKETSEAYICEADEWFLAGKPLPRPALAAFIVNDLVVANKYVRQGVAIAAPDSN